jgi:hypothetical protein
MERFGLHNRTHALNEPGGSAALMRSEKPTELPLIWNERLLQAIVSAGMVTVGPDLIIMFSVSIKALGKLHPNSSGL